ncbi:thiamine pyrophosphate-binding protein [Microbacterium sp. NIBRBAC000506063]|uniref:thiamine pyrophosphate-binding protein n=1 Tax=Microbacterium sp. NIBRBAC000506063 TaxID=2734618 RepID=UPI001BB5E764|nr:thiamine pyrophosphate-binding protein [Microbacterium sp. NIBRBAC000506063]QTV80487.1 thiamine pyrophosphate-binding protein [Microbacterium sp. NIBRBAC000506063]
MKGYQGIAKTLADEGVNVVFGLMAIDNMPLMAEIQKHGIRVIRSRTEHGAVCMADGYARVTGRPGVVSVGDGPGAAFTAVALMTASRRRSPVLLISADTPKDEPGNIKHFDQEGYFGVTGAPCFSAHDGASLSGALHSAFSRTTAGIGPAVVNCDLALLEGDLPDGWSPVVSTPATAEAAPTATIDAAVAVLTNARRPLILLGRGGLGAKAETSALADRLGAAIGTTLQADGALSDHRRNIGLVGGLGTPATKELLTQVDAILAVGASLTTFTTDFGRIFSPGAKVVHLDHDAEAAHPSIAVDITVPGDAGVALRQILDALGSEPGTASWPDELAPSEPAVPEVEYTRETGQLDPREFLDIFQVEAPQDRVVVTDAGHAVFFVLDRIPNRDPASRIWGADFSAMSVAIPLAIGAAVADPTRPVVAFLGDGAFMMSPSEIDTAVRESIPVTFVVLNDEAYGAEVHYLANWSLPPTSPFSTPPIWRRSRRLWAQKA